MAFRDRFATDELWVEAYDRIAILVSEIGQGLGPFAALEAARTPTSDHQSLSRQYRIVARAIARQR